MQHEVVVATGNRQGVELDRAESAENLEHGVGSSVERTRRRERVARDEKATCGLSRDPHAEDAIQSPAGSSLENVESGYLAALAQAKVLSAWINLPTFVKRHSRTLAQTSDAFLSPGWSRLLGPSTEPPDRSNRGQADRQPNRSQSPGNGAFSFSGG